MKIITLRQNKGFAIVDDEDFTKLSKHKWYLHGRTGYAVTGSKVGDRYYMHRLVLNMKNKGRCDKKNLFTVDHINGNSLDNQKNNLRLANTSQNSANSKKRKDNTSGFKGVSFFKYRSGRGKWSAYIQCAKKKYHLGYFNQKEEAARAYDVAATKMFGEYAYLNFK